MTSAYPLPPETLVEQVRGLAVELGELPSRNKIMKAFRVGSPKATAALDALREEGFEPTLDPTEPTRPETGSEVGLRPGLHIVKFQAPEPAEAGTGRSVSPVDAIENPPEGDGPGGSAPEEAGEAFSQATRGGHPGSEGESARLSRAPRWLALLIALPAFVAIWSGWVGLGSLTGFGEVALLPGIADEWVINSAITLPVGVEAYAAMAMWVWLGPGRVADQARRFARWSAIGSLVLGAAGQVAYHLMVAAGMSQAPWQITAFVACLPVVVLGCAAALIHLTHREES